MPPVWISFLESKGSGKLGRTDDAGQSSVLTSVRQVQDSRPEPSVEDSVGQTISFTEVGLEKSIEEDGRVRPRSVNLLGDSRVIDSKERKPGDVREEDGRCRPKDQGGFKGRVYGLLRPRALIKCRGSEEDQGKEQLTVGADPLGSSQGVLRGGRFVHPVGPCSGFLGMDGWGQQSHVRQIGFHGTPQEGHHAYPVGPSSGFTNRQVGFHGTPQEGHHAYPVGPSSGFTNRQVEFHGTPQEGHHAYPVGPSSGYPNRQVGFHGTPQEGHHAYPVGPSRGYTYRQLGFPQWAPQDWHPAYPVGPGSGHSGMQGWGHELQGVSRQRVRPYERPGTGGVGGGYQGRGVQRGPYYSGGPRVGPN